MDRTATLSMSRRRLVLVTAAVLALFGTAIQTAPTAHADAGAEAEFIALINQERASQGRPALTVAGDLTAVARAHSKVMADKEHLHHNPDLGGSVRGWRKVGENVGRGPSVGAIHKAFMDSSGHRRNILDVDWVEVGVGVEVRDGRIWVTEVFRLPLEAAAQPDPGPQPAPEAAPAPAPAAPAPEPEPEPEPQPHEVVETPLPLDRVTVTMARLEVAEGTTTLDEVLTD